MSNATTAEITATDVLAAPGMSRLVTITAAYALVPTGGPRYRLHLTDGAWTGTAVYAGYRPTGPDFVDMTATDGSEVTVMWGEGIYPVAL